MPEGIFNALNMRFFQKNLYRKSEFKSHSFRAFLF